MNTLRNAALLISAASLTAALTGCGGGEVRIISADPDAKPVAEPAEQAAATEPTAEPIEDAPMEDPIEPIAVAAQAEPAPEPEPEPSEIDRADNPFVVGQSVLLSTFDPERRTTNPGSPSTTLDRAGWQPIDFVVPVDGVRHDPNYRFLTSSRQRSRTARDRGDFPTYVSALDSSRASFMTDAIDATITAAYAAVETVALPVFVFVDMTEPTRYSSHTPIERTSENIDYFEKSADPITGEIPE